MKRFTVVLETDDGSYNILFSQLVQMAISEETLAGCAIHNVAHGDMIEEARKNAIPGCLQA